MRLRNARMLDLTTGVPGPPVDVCIAGDRIVRTADRSTEIDLAGRLVLPGLWDAHAHFATWARLRSRRDVSAATSAAGCARMVGAMLPDHAAGELFVGAGFHDPLWADSPSLEVLDAATGRVPVVLLSRDLHSAWLNSAAFARLDLPTRPSGRLVEEESFNLQRRLAGDDPVTADRLVFQAAEAAARLGVVGIIDMEMDPAPTQSWQRRAASGFNSLKVSVACYPDTLDAVIELGLSTGTPIGESGLVRQGPLKVIADGSLTARTAWCTQPYPDQHEHPTGILNLTLDGLVELMARAEQAGIQSAIHAIGDLAVSTVLDAFAETGAGGRVEHAQLIGPADIARMAALGIGASVQPCHVTDDRDAVDRLWPTRTNDAYPFRSLLDAGVPLFFGSDAPVAPLDPWAAVEAAVTRTTPGRPSWHPEQALSLSQALLASTGGVSTLVPGAPADLMVLETNPFEAEHVASVRPWLTMCAGRITYSE